MTKSRIGTMDESSRYKYYFVRAWIGIELAISGCCTLLEEFMQCDQPKAGITDALFIICAIKSYGRLCTMFVHDEGFTRVDMSKWLHLVNNAEAQVKFASVRRSTISFRVIHNLSQLPSFKIQNMRENNAHDVYM